MKSQITPGARSAYSRSGGRDCSFFGQRRFETGAHTPIPAFRKEEPRSTARSWKVTRPPVEGGIRGVRTKHTEAYHALRVRITNTKNWQERRSDCQLDWGPTSRNRIVKMFRAVAEKLDFVKQGTTTVKRAKSCSESGWVREMSTTVPISKVYKNTVRKETQSQPALYSGICSAMT